ncbi:MAG: hypothetical protein R3B93_11755 [Bacteroidia bacterium]
MTRKEEQEKNFCDWLVANEEDLIINGFNVVGGPTKEMGGFPETFSGLEVYDGVFVPE